MTKCDECVLLCAIAVTTIKNGAKQTTNANFTHSALCTAFLYWAMFSTFSWLGWCWTGSSAWAWWYLRVRKIFVYDAREIIRQSGIVMIRCKKVIRSSIFELTPLIVDIYKCSLREGYVPDLLKRSIINPQPKVSPPQEIQSDLRRGISNTRKSVSSNI